MKGVLFGVSGHQHLLGPQELAPIFEDIKKNGMEAAMKYYQDEARPSDVVGFLGKQQGKNNRRVGRPVLGGKPQKRRGARDATLLGCHLMPRQDRARPPKIGSGRFRS